MSMSLRGSVRAIWTLGALTIVAYGVWYYGFGVLIDPIRRAQGWSIAALGTAFGAAILVNGLGAAAGGRLLDRAGPRATFLLGAVLGGSGLALASIQDTVLGFGVCYAVGGEASERSASTTSPRLPRRGPHHRMAVHRQSRD